ncbi:Electron transfer flavoprotein subunit alpha [Ignavibacterium album JCM 16511]|uniref:Electron transfer flavoprotein subunit alpha n=1 Tax=Ignavibacterium album (strain DSM 19864 / JCM 16511 / NBRC 101810 / Mat9-16) TaxID=945713 RepID=I0AKP3_IGNAJ|nr:electron transfer flavoprotein subunit alpha/FixB family protein [Ignavibacterium album]AFH49550.1 Electron transfer flavoprotein subunit alpha [Ignavibacterium album JCM 16511]
MAEKILAVLEQREGNLKRVSFEAASVAVSLASQLGFEAEAVVVGSEINNLNELSKYGISKLTHLKNELLENYSPSAYSEMIALFANESGAKILIFPNTAMGVDLAPRVSVKLNAGIAMDCMKLEVKDNDIIATRPVYAGKSLIDVKLKSGVKIFTIRPNVFRPQPVDSATVQVEIKQVENPNLKTKVTAFKKSEGKIDVAEADIIVSGGRGMKGPENFHLIEELAEVLGAAVGASRAVVDAGWRPHREQVGQTGKTVSPSLYIACGISGAIQHLAGMSSSKYIVAINKDKDAPIFNVADYGIAGDVFEILPALTEEIKKLKS